MHPLLHPLFIDYCAYFNGNEDYFECHEVLEEYWKVVAPGEKLHPLVGYVQLATGMYHWRRENFDGAARILKKAIDNLETNEALEYLMLNDGIGPKVASCILLFSYKKYDVFPIDTWVKKFMKEDYNIEGEQNIKKFTSETYKEYSGLAIQYMFNYKRNKD